MVLTVRRNLISEKPLAKKMKLKPEQRASKALKPGEEPMSFR